MRDVDRTSESPLSAPPDVTAWRIVMTEPRQERAAVQELRRAGYAAWFPQETKIVENRAKREKAKVNVPLFARYVFVGLMPMADKPIKDCRRVTCLLPYTVPVAMISDLHRRQDGREFDSVKAADKARQKLIGKRTRIVNGPFAGFDNIVQKAEQERALVLVDIFGRETSVWINIKDIAA
jgi:transcription antitermination factor NusG